jgi:hypothetical protein
MNWRGCEGKQKERLILDIILAFDLRDRKTMQNLSQSSQSPGQDWKLGPPEQEEEVIITSWCSAYCAPPNEKRRMTQTGNL